MTKEIIIVLLLIALIYLYYQNKKLKGLAAPSSTPLTEFHYSSDSEDETPFPSRQKLQFELTQKENQISSLQTEIARLKENREVSEDYQELETERDEAIREKQTAEQEVQELGKKLKSKNQEVANKDKEIQRLKDEKSVKEISLNKQIKELKEKYSKQGQQLDEEQLENNKLTEANEKLQQQIQELTRSSPMPGEFPPDQSELIKQHQEQLKQINLLFDDQAQNYPAIDFNGLYSLLQNIADEQKKKTVEPVHQKYRKKKK